MPTPHSVSPSNFPNPSILYDNKDFAIAAGNYTEAGKTEFAIGMRWNNGPGTKPGYPRVINNPVWFIITPELVIPILNAIVGLLDSDKAAITSALNQFEKYKSRI